MTLVFARRSWHARLNKWAFDYDPAGRVSLCPYFWHVALAMVATPFIFVGRPLRKRLTSLPETWQTVLGVLLLILFVGIVVGYPIYVSLVHNGLVVTLMLVVITAGIVAAYLSVAYLVMRWSTWRNRREYDRIKAMTPKELIAILEKYRVERKRQRQPGLLRLWLGAKKEKVCPYVEWDAPTAAQKFEAERIGEVQAMQERLAEL